MADIETLTADTRYFAQVAAPGTPSASQGVLYVKTDGKIYFKNDAGTEYDLGTSSTPTFVGARAHHNTTQSINDSAWTALNLNSERYDTDAFHDTATNNSRLTVPSAKDGKYLITANVEFAANGTGVRFVQIFLNGITTIALYGPQPGHATLNNRMSVSTVYDLVATDYVEIRVWQSSGGPLNSNSAANYAPEFTISLLGS